MTDMSHAPCKTGPLEVWLPVDASVGQIESDFWIINVIFTYIVYVTLNSSHPKDNVTFFVLSSVSGSSSTVWGLAARWGWRALSDASTFR